MDFTITSDGKKFLPHLNCENGQNTVRIYDDVSLREQVVKCGNKSSIWKLVLGLVIDFNFSNKNLVFEYWKATKILEKCIKDG